MIQKKSLVMVFVIVAACAVSTPGQTTITLGLSGPGAVNDSTIKAGQPVSVDVYWESKDVDIRGFTTGFRVYSPTIKAIVHVADSGKGINPAGDLKAHGGWEGTNTWDFSGIRVIPTDWDGTLPDTIGFGGARAKVAESAHPRKKVLSWTMLVPTTGQILVDSTFFRPSNIWAVALTAGKEVRPLWNGPYKFSVIE
ncbi:MAG: hypothetical protein AB1772_07995 [Candidatus Zixiibacteriota bacterium]